MSSVWGGKGEEEKVGSLRESDTEEQICLFIISPLIPYVFTFKVQNLYTRDIRGASKYLVLLKFIV